MSKKRQPRKDPQPRHIDGTADWARIDNKDPHRHYVLVNKGDTMALGKYRMYGYVTETAREDGPRPFAGATVQPGQELEVMGCVLMSIDKKRWADIVENGVDGQSGLQLADRNEEAMLAPEKHGEDDGTRGRSRARRTAFRGFEIENTSQSEA